MLKFIVLCTIMLFALVAIGSHKKSTSKSAVRKILARDVKSNSTPASAPTPDPPTPETASNTGVAAVPRIVRQMIQEPTAKAPNALEAWRAQRAQSRANVTSFSSDDEPKFPEVEGARMFARGIPYMSDNAIVCKDYASVRALLAVHTQAKTDRRADEQSRGITQYYRPDIQEPGADSYAAMGCESLPPGTPSLGGLRA